MYLEKLNTKIIKYFYKDYISQILEKKNQCLLARNKRKDS